MLRIVEAETLDHLAPDDPVAERSRRDLRRVNAFMGARSILATAMRLALPHGAPAGRPLRLLEIGCGDGRLLHGVAGQMRSDWPAVELTLLDRQPIVEPATIASYAQLGWQAKPLVADVLAWADAKDAGPRFDLVVTNLFLHHFEQPQLVRLVAALAARSGGLVACEPRRGRLALAASYLVVVLGANAVTRQDAVLSVRAGFTGHELTDLWPRDAGWACREHAAGLFSHLFMATHDASDAR